MTQDRKSGLAQLAAERQNRWSEYAAHIESQEYDAVGQAEVEAGIAVAKEVLKAVFQYAALVKQLKR